MIDWKKGSKLSKKVLRPVFFKNLICINMLEIKLIDWNCKMNEIKGKKKVINGDKR